MLSQFLLHGVHYGGNATCMMHVATLHNAFTAHDIVVQFTLVNGICGSSTCFLHEAYYRGNATCMLLVLVMTKPVTCMMHVVTTHVAYTVYTPVVFFTCMLHVVAVQFTCMGHSSAQLFLQLCMFF